MANNDFRPCVYIIPEDDANRQIADGFILHHRVTNQVQIMPMAGGWENVVQVIKEEYYPKLRNRIAVTVVGLIDCDEQSNRLGDVLHTTPEDIRDRIFFLSVLKNPEALKAIVNQRFEAIGEQLANECATETYEMWNHEHLRHIANEADRAKATLRPILFPIE